MVAAMSSTNSITVGDSRLRATLIPLADMDGPVDDRWPPLATLAFVVTASGGLWAGIIMAARQLLL